MKKKITYLCLLVFVLVSLGIIAIVSGVAARTSANPQITWSVVGGGGGHVETTDGRYALDSTIAQPITGEMSVTTDGDTTELCAGFWCAWESWLDWFKAYLPITLRE